MNEKQLATTEKARLTYGKDDMSLLSETFFKGATPAEVKLGMILAAQYQLDPFLKEIYFVPRVGLMIGRDGLLKAARRHPDFLGMSSGVIYKGATIDINYENGIVNCPITAEMLVGKDKPVGAWAVVLRKGQRPTVEIVRWSEYAKGGVAWETYQSAMIEKCAQSKALRIAFNVNGLVPADEGVITPEMHNVTPAPEITNDRVKAMKEKIESKQNQEAVKEFEAEIVKERDPEQLPFEPKPEEMEPAPEPEKKRTLGDIRAKLNAIDETLYNDIVIDVCNGELLTGRQMTQEQKEAVYNRAQEVIEARS